MAQTIVFGRLRSSKKRQATEIDDLPHHLATISRRDEPSEPRGHALETSGTSRASIGARLGEDVGPAYVCIRTGSA